MKLSKFNNSWYKPGKNVTIRAIWYLVNILFFINPLNIFNSSKIMLLRCFGAVIGNGVHIKPSVNIKFPWNLKVGDNVWIGENVWIDNLSMVAIGNDVCISQGVMLLCGNHNYKLETFDLIVKDITIDDNCWIGAKSVVCPGVRMNKDSVLCVGSIASKDIESNSIYRGNPAIKVKDKI